MLQQTHLRRKNRNTRQEEEDQEHQTDTGQTDTDEARKLDLSTHALPRLPEEATTCTGVTRRRDIGERETGRRSEKANTRNHDEEKTNTRNHDEPEERRRTRGITMSREGEFKHK